MKRFNKQILEAVNRGIQLAIDDYEDIENNNSISHYNDVIDSEDVIRKRIFANFVDLGLPSKTLWAKYNLGVDPNKLKDDSLSWNGDYYQWGELEPNTFKLYVDKYNEDDKLKTLLPEDDVVTQKYGTYFHMPTLKQCQELKKYTTYRFINNYNNIKGLNGLLLTSKKNGAELFFPANGFISNNYSSYVGNAIYIWTKDFCVRKDEVYKKQKKQGKFVYKLTKTYIWNGPHCFSYHNHNSQFDYISLDWIVRTHGVGIRAVYNEV